MKHVIATLIVAAGMPLLAAEKLTQAERDRIIMEKIGGFVVVPAKGSIVVINAQQTLSAGEIEDYAAFASKNIQIPISVKNGVFDIKSAKPTVVKFGGSAGIFIVDDAAMPTSLVCAEELWGLVNIAKMKEGAVYGEALSKRTRKEFNRVLAMVFGGGLSSMKTSIMRPVKSAADLDKTVNPWIPFDTLNLMFGAFQDYGITRRKQIPYKRACIEGWAPAPTNKYQKAIWDKIHSLPKSPMKIEFDPKKGR